MSAGSRRDKGSGPESPIRKPSLYSRKSGGDTTDVGTVGMRRMGPLRGQVSKVESTGIIGRLDGNEKLGTKEDPHFWPWTVIAFKHY